MQARSVFLLCLPATTQSRQHYRWFNHQMMLYQLKRKLLLHKLPDFASPSFPYKYIMPITKINKETDFSPWEEDCLNIIRAIRSPKPKRPLRDTSKTIIRPATPHSCLRSIKKPIDRACMSLSKIDFYHPPAMLSRPATPQKQFSFKYEGPRLNFYLSMNPKQLRLSTEHRSPLKTIERDSLVSTNTSNQPADSNTYRTLEEKTMKRDPSFSHMKLLGNAANIKRMKDEHKNMKKLKILYHSRALKKKV